MRYLVTVAIDADGEWCGETCGWRCSTNRGRSVRCELWDEWLTVHEEGSRRAPACIEAAAEMEEA